MDRAFRNPNEDCITGVISAFQFLSGDNYGSLRRDSYSINVIELSTGHNHQFWLNRRQYDEFRLAKVLGVDNVITVTRAHNEAYVTGYVDADGVEHPHEETGIAVRDVQQTPLITLAMQGASQMVIDLVKEVRESLKSNVDKASTEFHPGRKAVASETSRNLQIDKLLDTYNATTNQSTKDAIALRLKQLGYEGELVPAGIDPADQALLDELRKQNTPKVRKEEIRAILTSHGVQF